MAEKSYYEKVAEVMARSHVVGRYQTYDDILAALKRRFATEDELRASVLAMETTVTKLFGSGDGFHLVDNH